MKTRYTPFYLDILFGTVMSYEINEITDSALNSAHASKCDFI